MLGKKGLRSGNAGVPDVSRFLRSASYYDFALAFVPLPLLVGLFAGKLLSLSPRFGVSIGATLSALAVGHLLFRDPPRRRGPRGRVGGPSA